MRRPRFTGRPSPSLVVATLALVAAASGAAGATAALDGANLVPGSVTAAKLADGAVTRPKVATAAVGTHQIANRSITAVKFAGAPVGTHQIANGSVTRVKIADGAIASAQVASASLTGSDLANGTISGAKIAKGTITRANLAASVRPRVVMRFVTRNIPVGKVSSIVARCRDGEVTVGGGYGGAPSSAGGNGSQAVVNADRPDPIAQGKPSTGWFVQLQNRSAHHATSFSVYALCEVGG